MGKEELVIFSLFFLLMSCDCYCFMALPQGDIGYHAVSDCCIS